MKAKVQDGCELAPGSALEVYGESFALFPADFTAGQKTLDSELPSANW